MYKSGPRCIVKVIFPKETRMLYLDPLGETPDHLNKCKDVTRQATNRQLKFSLLQNYIYIVLYLTELYET